MPHASLYILQGQRTMDLKSIRINSTTVTTHALNTLPPLTNPAHHSMQMKRNEYDPPSGREDEGESTDEEWVDEDEEEKVIRTRQPTVRPSPANSDSMAYGVRSIQRKRGSRKAASVANVSQKQVPPQYASAHSASQSPEEHVHEMRDAVLRSIVKGTLCTTRYTLDVLAAARRLSKWPISAFLVFWLIPFMIGNISPAVRRAFAPICIIPGISSTSICQLQVPNISSRVPGPNFSALVEFQSNSFEKLLWDSVGESALPLEIKKAEMATADLAVRVQASDLKAKDTLAASLRDFVRDARRTGRSLQKLSSKVEGAVDSIMAVNDYALQCIKDARANEASVWDMRALMPWKPPRQNLNEVIARTFNEAMNVLSNHMERLILEAEDNLINLNKLEERLATLYEIICREDSTISLEKSELLADLWTKLGGNRQSLRDFDRHLDLLKNLSGYRKKALDHVTAALQTLHAMSDDMEDMRERVAAPDLIGASIPAEVHIKSIHIGLERLREGRTRAQRVDQNIRKHISSPQGNFIE